MANAPEGRRRRTQRAWRRHLSSLAQIPKDARWDYLEDAIASGWQTLWTARDGWLERRAKASGKSPSKPLTDAQIARLEARAAEPEDSPGRQFARKKLEQLGREVPA